MAQPFPPQPRWRVGDTLFVEVADGEHAVPPSQTPSLAFRVVPNCTQRLYRVYRCVKGREGVDIRSNPSATRISCSQNHHERRVDYASAFDSQSLLPRTRCPRARGRCPTHGKEVPRSSALARSGPLASRLSSGEQPAHRTRRDEAPTSAAFSISGKVLQFWQPNGGGRAGGSGGAGGGALAAAEG